MVKAGSSNTDLAINGHTLTFFDALSIDTDNYPTVYGASQIRTNAAAVFTPKNSSTTETTGALTADSLIKVEWYQPTQTDAGFYYD